MVARYRAAVVDSRTFLVKIMKSVLGNIVLVSFEIQPMEKLQLTLGIHGEMGK